MAAPGGHLIQHPHHPLGRLSLVFVPTAPHPFTGYLVLIPNRELIPISMGFHDAMKMEFSCGLFIPQPAQVAPTIQTFSN